MTPTLEQRFWSKVERSGTCLVWTAGTTSRGYGHFRDGGAMELAHRWSYRQMRGPIPEGLCVCHHCDNPLCVRPDHLFLGTHSDNMSDMVAKGRGAGATGEANGGCKLTGEEVQAIRNSYKPGSRLPDPHSARCLAEEYGVTKGHIQALARGEKRAAI